MILQLRQLADLAAFAHTPFGCRVYASAQAYGMDEPFSKFWGQRGSSSSNEKIHAVLGKMDDVLIAESSAGADFEELREMCKAVDAKVLLCSTETALGLGFAVTRGGPVLRLGQRGPWQTKPFEQNPSLREIHALLEKCRGESFVPPEFEPFYMDMSHRIRHGAGLSVGLRENGTLAAAALCSTRTETCAVISGVACLPNFRRHGLGATAVNALLSMLTQEDVFVFRAAGENAAFYEKLGFLPYGNWAEILL